MTGQTSDTVQALRARRHELAAAIAQIGFTATGTMLQVRTVCGSPGCACHADPDKRHGPYWQHTRKISNKTITRRLTPDQAALYAEWISNERALRDLLARMQQLSDQARELLLAALPEPPKPGG
ncbi:MAG: DUF6788 family protein [Streptosporangiaceae bacterium]